MESWRRLALVTPLLGLGLITGSGCESETVLELRREVAHLQESIEQKDHELAARQATIEQLHEQIQDIRGLKPEDLERIFYPEKIEIDSLSGGDDYDGQPGDDGITVYLKPIDRDGDAVKVAGDIRIELYDLANPPDQNLIGKYEVPVEQVHELWYGKLATYHYTIRCPWQQGPPRHKEITIRATFQDFLTGRVITAQTVCTVKPAP